LGGSGFLTDSKNPAEVALLMQKILSDTRLRNQIIANQNERLQDFQYEKIKTLFAGQLRSFLQEKST
ncbi:MAG: glycosyltransferase, partial [Oscillospiraceae bacterium]|nr:glycosyltransferase [Oscillospiraceae bacterium]